MNEEKPMRDRRYWLAILAGAAGGTVAIGAMEFVAIRQSMPIMAVPFATSIVLVLGSPEVEAAQPRALIGGHLVASLIGLLVVHLAGPAPWAAAIAVGLAMVAMHATRTFHPPAGIDPLLIVINNAPWSFLLMPVALGAVMLVAFAYAWHLAVRRFDWPTARWW
jgi:CBS-domain-containing membrane protein